MLSTMDPRCELFKKNYVRPKVNRFAFDENEEDADMVSNPEGWFDDLPLAKNSKKTTLRFTTNQPSENQKLKRLQAQRALLERRMQSQQERVAFMDRNRGSELANEQEMAEPPQLVEDSVHAACNSMPVIEQMNNMIINSGGPNIIGNQEEQPEPRATECYPGNTEMVMVS